MVLMHSVLPVDAPREISIPTKQENTHDQGPKTQTRHTHAHKFTRFDPSIHKLAT